MQHAKYARWWAFRDSNASIQFACADLFACSLRAVLECFTTTYQILSTAGCLSICLSCYLPVCLSALLSVDVSFCLSVCPSVCPPARTHIKGPECAQWPQHACRAVGELLKSTYVYLQSEGVWVYDHTLPLELLLTYPNMALLSGAPYGTPALVPGTVTPQTIHASLTTHVDSICNSVAHQQNCMQWAKQPFPRHVYRLPTANPAITCAQVIYYAQFLMCK